MNKKNRALFSIRNWTQIAVFIVTVGIGLQFYMYVHQSAGDGAATVSRPPGVEGFLPIGALMGWKLFIQTGEWDAVHPTAMVILGFAILLSFLLRKSFCGWFCPVGTVSEWCWRARRFLPGRVFRIPGILDIPLRGVKYILLGLFIYAISTMSADQIRAFVQSPYYKLSDVKMLFFFTRMTLLTAGVLSALLILSFFFKNFWCRYLCPYGGLLGIFSWISPTRIQRSETYCTHCGNCDRVCPSLLPVSSKPSIHSPECTGCMDCVRSCPAAGALSLKTAGFHQRSWQPKTAVLFILLLFLSVFYAANLTGHWRSGVSDHEFRVRLGMIDAPGNTHPSINF